MIHPARFAFVKWSVLLVASSVLLASCSAPQKAVEPVAPAQPAAAAPLPRLGSYSIDESGITVSGLSAGAMLAVQLHLSHSSLISGIGTVAGGAYGCAEGSFEHGLNVCMLKPSGIDVRKSLAKAKDEAAHGKIDALKNLKRSHVVVIAGQKDPVVLPEGGAKLAKFYESFVPKKNVRTNFAIPAGHGFPTVDQGNACGATATPWIEKCGHDSAEEILKNLYGNLKPAVAAKPENLMPFDQTEFYQGDIGFHTEGFVYVPSNCRTLDTKVGGPASTKCKLHVALHGCDQTQDQVGDAFRARAGYNRWAEANSIIVLYPSGKISSYPGTNRNDIPPGCFDWWGYTGKDYLNKNGPQIKALRAMIDRVRAAQP